jgi:steroid delta-isomerase-like uncharacterized protein
MASAVDQQSSNRDLIYRFTEECWNRGDLAKVPEMMAEGCQHHDPVFPHMAAGTESVQRLIERIRRAFPDVTFTIIEAVCREDEVDVHWNASATQVAEFLGIPPKEQSASINGKSTYRVVDGKIVENWVDWNVMSLMKQLGGAFAGKLAEPWAKAG